jgi:hypothetical protein
LALHSFLTVLSNDGPPLAGLSFSTAKLLN